jgi:dTDP-4-dehydrorhamnose reductase
MNLLLIGSNGYLGSYLYEHLQSICTIDTKIKQPYYDFFINCAGKTNISYCENNPRESSIANAHLTKDIYNKTKINKIIYFSSYYVYDDIPLCNETSNVTSHFIYARDKLLGELFTTQNNGFVFRLGKLYGHQNIKKQKRLTEAILQEEKLTVDQCLFNPTSLATVLQVVLTVLQSNIPAGTYNVSDSGYCSHLEYAQYIVNQSDLTTIVTGIERMSFPILTNYNRFCMDTSKLQHFVYTKPWQFCVNTYLNKI